MRYLCHVGQPVCSWAGHPVRPSRRRKFRKRNTHRRAVWPRSELLSRLGSPAADQALNFAQETCRRATPAASNARDDVLVPNGTTTPRPSGLLALHSNRCQTPLYALFTLRRRDLQKLL